MSNRPYQDIGDRLERLRLHLRMTKRDFAATIGVNEVSYGRYEAGSRIDVDVIRKVSRTHGVSTEWLLHGTGEMLRSNGSQGGDLSRAEDVLPYLDHLSQEESMKLIHLVSGRLTSAV